jgi:hypothetical protein
MGHIPLGRRNVLRHFGARLSDVLLSILCKVNGCLHDPAFVRKQRAVRAF